MSEHRNWVALGYRLSSLPSRNRVYVWRKLKELGAVYFESGVALLPLNDNTLARMRDLRADILRFGGSASLTSMEFLYPEDEEAAVQRFNESIRNDYGEVERMFQKILTDVEAVRKSGKASLFFIENRLNMLRRTKKVLERIQARDCFRVSDGSGIDRVAEKARARVDRCLRDMRGEAVGAMPGMERADGTGEA